jgi:hypothetical protein
MEEKDCNCPLSRTDGQDPCGKGLRYERPDGRYCDCGHNTECCEMFGLWLKWKEKEGKDEHYDIGA